MYPALCYAAACVTVPVSATSMSVTAPVVTSSTSRIYVCGRTVLLTHITGETSCALTSKVWRMKLRIFHIFSFISKLRLDFVRSYGKQRMSVPVLCTFKPPFPRSFLPIKGHASVTHKATLYFIFAVTR